MIAGDSPDELAIREIRSTRHGARVHDVDLRRFVFANRPEPMALEKPYDLLGLDLIQAAAQRRDGDGDRWRHAITASLSWPHAAPISSPLLHRTVAVMPRSSSALWKARILGRGG